MEKKKQVTLSRHIHVSVTVETLSEKRWGRRVQLGSRTTTVEVVLVDQITEHVGVRVGSINDTMTGQELMKDNKM
jgi:hypothetical protein